VATRTLFRYVLSTCAAAFAGIFAAMIAIYLVVDFVDTGSTYRGPDLLWNLADLYANRALVVARQLAPPALLLAAAVAVSTLRKRGELTAMRALGVQPATLYLPVAALALLVCACTVAFDEAVVVSAGRRVDDILTQRFDRWGDWRLYFLPKQWVRRGDWIFYLRAGDVDGGFTQVTLLRVDGRFELQQRLDAERMEPTGDGRRWRLTAVQERTFREDGQSPFRTLAELEVDLGVTRDDLRLRVGRPEQMRLPELREQIRVRRELGLPTGQLQLALHNRFAYPLAGLPGALLAVGLALRPNRKGHLTRAVVEGLGIVLAMWCLMVVGRTLALAQRLPVSVAAWLPAVALGLLAAALWLEAEGKLGRLGLTALRASTGARTPPPPPR
jgi:lipopolysaccharide export system permease protein